MVPRLYDVASFKWHLRIFGQIGKLNRDLIFIFILLFLLFLISVASIVTIRHFVIVVLLHRFVSFGLLGLGYVFRICLIALPGWP